MLAAMIKWRWLGGDHSRDIGELRSNRQIDIIEELAERETEVLTIADAFGKRAQTTGTVAPGQALFT